MDAMGFGMGLCCLQLTFQAHSMAEVAWVTLVTRPSGPPQIISNLIEARELYDQLAPLCPIMLALTASSPAHRGILVDRDCRYVTLAGEDEQQVSHPGR